MERGDISGVMSQAGASLRAMRESGAAALRRYDPLAASRTA